MDKKLKGIIILFLVLAILSLIYYIYSGHSCEPGKVWDSTAKECKNSCVSPKPKWDGSACVACDPGTEWDGSKCVRNPKLYAIAEDDDCREDRERFTDSYSACDKNNTTGKHCYPMNEINKKYLEGIGFTNVNSETYFQYLVLGDLSPDNTTFGTDWGKDGDKFRVVEDHLYGRFPFMVRVEEEGSMKLKPGWGLGGDYSYCTPPAKEKSV